MAEYSHPPIPLLTLPKRSLAYYWRTNVPVVLGVAIAVAALTGALAIGDSVRASLLRIFLDRLGKTSHVLQAGHFFREELAAELQAQSPFQSSRWAVCPILLLDGLVSHQRGGRRAASVQVYGIDERFWDFHQAVRPEAAVPPRSLWLSPALAEELAAEQGDTLLVRVEKPSAIPAESLHGRKEDRGLTLRCESLGVLPELADFSLRAGQSEVRAAFIPLQRLQKELGLGKRVNTILASGPDAASSIARHQDTELASALRAACKPFDLGLRMRQPADAGFSIVEHESTLLGAEDIAAILRAANKAGLRATPILTYLANSIRAGSKTIPYSLVTAMDFGALPAFTAPGSSERASAGLPRFC